MEDLAQHGPASAVCVHTLRVAYRAFVDGTMEDWREALRLCAAIEKSGGENSKAALLASSELEQAIGVFDTMREHTMRNDPEETTDQKKADGAVALAMLRSALIGFNAATLAMGGIDTYQVDSQFTAKAA